MITSKDYTNYWIHQNKGYKTLDTIIISTFCYLQHTLYGIPVLSTLDSKQMYWVISCVKQAEALNYISLFILFVSFCLMLMLHNYAAGDWRFRLWQILILRLYLVNSFSVMVYLRTMTVMWILIIVCYD